MSESENGRLPLENGDRGKLGELMSTLVHLVGVSQAEAAKQIGVASSTLSQWCSGARAVDPVGLLWGLRAVDPGDRPAAVRAVADAVYGPTYPGRWVTTEQRGNIGRFIADGAVTLGEAAKILGDGVLSRDEAPAARVMATKMRELAATLDGAAGVAEGRSTR